MHLRNFNLRHVTARAVFCAYRTCCPRVILRGLRHWGGEMAVEALLVIRGRVFHQRDVRVMTSNAGDPRIAGAPTFAVLQAIRLRPNTGNTFDTREPYVPPRTVTRAAKIHRIRRTEFAGIENQIRCVLVSYSLLKNARFHGVGMLGAGAVARLTSDSRA